MVANGLSKAFEVRVEQFLEDPSCIKLLKNNPKYTYELVLGLEYIKNCDREAKTINPQIIEILDKSPENARKLASALTILYRNNLLFQGEVRLELGN